MKQIKKIVLRDATKLTNSEMKKIRGGANGEPPGSYSAVCSAVCYNHTGAVIGNIDNNPNPCPTKCEVVYEYGVGKIKCANSSYGYVAICPDVDLLPPPIE